MRVRLVATAVLLLAPLSVFARDYNSFGPFTTRAQNPVYLQVLQLTPMRANVLPRGTLETRVDSTYSSVFHVAGSPATNVDMQMGYWRNTVAAAYGLGKDFELGIEVPLLNFNGSFLDGFVQLFHSFFGFPNNARSSFPNGRYSYSFTAGGANRFDFESTALGLGDIALHLKNRLVFEGEGWPAVSWFASLKFPTGRKSRGFGSGTPDFGLGAALEKSYKRLHGFLDVGYYAIGGGSYLEGYMRNESLNFALAGELTILPTWTFLVQFYGGTPLLMGTGMHQWDGAPLDLVIGFKGAEPGLLKFGDFTWQVAFAEDLTSRGPSVDFTVFASVGARFGKR